ncbi:MAG: ammonium transporter [Acidimicrobiales bacterium]
MPTRLPSQASARRPVRRKLIVGLGLAITALLASPAAAGAQDVDPVEAITAVSQQVNLLWIVIGAILVIFMQAGFALVETGFCRAKHAAHVVSTNFAIFGLGFVAFFLVGYGFMFGGFSYVLPGFDFGYTDAVGDAALKAGDWVFLWKGGFALTDLSGPAGAAVLGYFLYMVAFMDTVATIPTGSMAERWQWKNFVLWGFFCGAVYYPLFGAWTWGGGWLNQLGNNLELGFGYVDFAGSGIVHAMGGAAALAGAIVLGPRIGKFNADGSANTIPGHHIPMAMLGTFILLFGWFGFNAASTFAATDVQLAVVAANTAIAAAFGAVVSMLWTMWKSGKPDPGMMANGMLAGLVAITAPCAFVGPQAAAVIGLIAGILVVESIGFIERRGIDDAVGAISVHGVCGTFGVLAVGIFANGTYGAGWNLTTDGAAGSAAGVTGILTDVELGLRQLASQGIGAGVIWTVMLGLAFAWFKLSDKITPIRSAEADEVAGLDLAEMGALAYPEFEFAIEVADPEVGHRPMVGSARGSIHQGELPHRAPPEAPSDDDPVHVD